MNIFGSRRNALLVLIDVVIFAFAYFVLAVLAKISSSSVMLMPVGYVLNGSIILVSVLVFRVITKVYVHMWRYATYSGYLRLIIADFAGGSLGLFVTYFIGGAYIGLWQTVCVVCGQLIAAVAARLSYQYVRGKRILRSQSDYTYVAIIGAGSVGAALLSEFRGHQHSKYRPWCLLDNDKHKIGRVIDELKVYDVHAKSTIDILKASPVKEVIIAISSKNASEIHELYTIYSAEGFKVRIYDFSHEVGDGKDSSASYDSRLRDVSIEDLLFRKPVEIPEKDIDSYRGKVVLVTGGGGSIGSEICRQIAKLSPKQLVVFDIYENNAYDLQQELKITYGGSLNLAIEIGSVRDRSRLESVFSKYRPNVVFHAAAHKHVPLMEQSSGETVKNNVLGTCNTADMAEKYGADKFILISTDKAVNPTNIMGASKRMCEMIVQCRTDSKTSFAAVRFGNVLGSNGSVIPLFKRQIAAGGPVTITDKRIIRYFMTIPEASRLVLLVGSYAKRGELFVLDMGKPVPIIALAENLIRMSGFEPYKDIAIEEIGLRPGEKLYEELLIRTEEQKRTENSMIFVEWDTPLTRDEVDRKIAVLTDAVLGLENNPNAIRDAYKSVVPTFKDPDEINRKIGNVEKAEEICRVEIGTAARN